MKPNQTITLTDLDTEQELLAVICNYPTYVKEVQKIIKPDVFHYESTRNVYLTCIELYSEKGKFTLPDVILRLKTKGSKDWASVMTAQSTKSPLNAGELLIWLAELKGKRDLLILSKEISSDILNGTDYFSLLDKINNAVSNEIVKDNSLEVVSMKDALLSAVNNLGDVMTNGNLSGVPTGYPKLDDITGGWLKGNVILFAARPGQGKTIALLEHARCAAELNNNVLFLSLEMPVISLIYRMISGQLDDGLPYSKIKTGRLSIDQFTKIQRTAVSNLEKLSITWYDGANRDINYLTSMIQKIVREKNIDIVVIDYIQLMSDSSIKSSNETEIVGSVADKVQMLAKKLNIPFLCAAQLNRSNEGRMSHRPRLSDLRSSGKLEQMASSVIGLYREDYYAYEKAKEEMNPNVEFNNIIEYIFMKQRDGECKTLDLFIDPKTSTIKELKEELPPNYF